MVTDATSGEKKDHLFVILNPEIVAEEGEQNEEEGCLSIPGFSSNVLRPRRVALRGVDLNGKDIVLEGTDLLARAFCHEMDHLNGKFFLDLLTFGLLAPRARWRSAIVPKPAPDGARADAGTRSPSRWPWARLLRRVFAIDVLVCPRCAGPRRIVGAVTKPHAVRRLLGTLGLAAEPPPDRPVPAA